MPIFLTWLALVIFGILAVYSVSIHKSFTLTLKQFWDPSNYFYFFRHIRSIGIATVVALIFYRIPLQFFKDQKKIIIIVVILFILQAMVFIPWIWMELQGARWWLDIPFLPSIQPSEFFKLWYVLFMAGWFVRKKKTIDNDNQLLISFVVINVIFLAIFLLIPDFWNILVMWATGLTMAIYAWLNWKKAIWLLVAWAAATLLFWTLASMVSPRFAYIQKRMTYFISSSNDENSMWIGWQNEQALAAIGGWWFLGKWYGKGLQKFGYIPEAQSDFIFAAFSEEIGFVWDIILLWLYVYLIYYVLSKLVYVKDEHYKLLAVWTLSLIIVQAFINMWVNLLILPNTGLTLPFISHGGSALMANFMSLVLLYKIIHNKE